LTYRIQRLQRVDRVVFALSGDMNREHAGELTRLLAAETSGDVVLDLQDITVVDREAVEFLAGTETAGTRLMNCPDYVRSWIDAERNGA
jgi:anti-anti-sigma regulatory factor